MGSLTRRRQWLLSGAAVALFLVVTWSTGGPRGGSSSVIARWGTGSHSTCRESLAATRESIIGQRQPQLDGYDTCGCRTVQSIRDPFYSSSGTYRAHEMEPVATHTTENTATVLVLSHGRLQRLNLATREVTVLLHRPGLRIRGMFSDGNGTPLPKTYVLLTTPSLNQDSRFMGIDGRSSKVVYDVPAEGSRDAHDVVRHGDDIFVVSTGTGEVRVYDGTQPGRFPLLRSIAAAEPGHPEKSHINTVGVSPSAVWVMRHNQGKRPAEVHVLDRYAERSLDVYADVGQSSHGLAHWGEELIVLDSLNGRVLAVHRVTKTTRVVWSCTQSCFLKGLAVIDDTILVGVAPPQRRMDRMRINCSLVAISLADNGEEKWKLSPTVDANGVRSATSDAAGNVLITAGLLNQIVPLPYPNDPAFEQSLQHMALMSLDLKRKAARNIDKSGVQVGIGYRVLGGVSINDARAELQRNWKEAWTSSALRTEHLFAPGLNAKFPGVQHLRLLFSTGERIESLGGLPADTCMMLPGWRRFGSVVYPMLAQLFEQRLGFTHGSWEQRLLRVQLNSMPPGSEILPHSDTGSYARNAHRIHIPLIVPQCVQFEQRLPAFAGGDGSWSEVPFKEGEAFEVNNLLPHHVQQRGPYERVTLILDLADTPCRRTIEVSNEQKCPSFNKHWWTSKECVLDENVTLEDWKAAVGR